jgi:hypothetical protein
VFVEVISKEDTGMVMASAEGGGLWNTSYCVGSRCKDGRLSDLFLFFAVKLVTQNPPKLDRRALNQHNVIQIPNNR